MTKPRKQRFVPVLLGPKVPLVPITAFSKQTLTHDQWDRLWQIIGPSVDRNMNGMRALPLWKVIASAYLEGLWHGACITEEQANGQETEATKDQANEPGGHDHVWDATTG